MNAEALMADGLDDAFCGMVERFGSSPVACYDTQKVLEIFVERDGMSMDEANEHFQFNVLGAYLGENTPVFLVNMSEE
ncbi:MAG: hypothetical protein CMO74_15250 [Verrucomicrobiales bacterium]|nr:hypothetical protein [Verrucomicrobiales bacterium]